MNYVRIIYTSIIYEHLNNEQTINDIMQQSQINNKKYKIGGKLLWNYGDGSVLQILEGPSLAVHKLLNVIKNDRRHKNIVIESCSDIGTSDRHYEVWTSNAIQLVNQFKNQESITDYDIKRIIGTGGSSTVVLGMHRISGKKVAIKMINKRRINPKTMQRVITERDLLAKLKHNMVQKLICSLQDAVHIYFVTPFACCGDLYSCVKYVDMTPEIALFYLSEIICGLHYLHSHKIIHNDIKLENVLIHGDGHIVLTDFGISEMNNSETRIAGTPCYFAPEIFETIKKTQKSDIWAMGIMLFEMFNKHPPWQGLSHQKMACEILQSNLVDMINCEDTMIRNIMQLLCEHDPEKRAGTTRLMELFLEQNIVPSWEVVEKKMLPIPYIPQHIHEERTTIPDFEVLRRSTAEKLLFEYEEKMPATPYIPSNVREERLTTTDVEVLHRSTAEKLLFE